ELSLHADATTFTEAIYLQIAERVLMRSVAWWVNEPRGSHRLHRRRTVRRASARRGCRRQSREPRAPRPARVARASGPRAEHRAGAGVPDYRRAPGRVHRAPRGVAAAARGRDRPRPRRIQAAAVVGA